jgi:hypothetical protein
MNLRLLDPDIQGKLIFHERVQSATDIIQLCDLQAELGAGSGGVFLPLPFHPKFRS